MQLRKEQNNPFFHEYVLVVLSDGYCFRIDRRQLPSEPSPLDCAKDGVEAYDTIEQMTSLEDLTDCPSDCLVQLDFGRPVSVDIVFAICRGIARHPKARLYTAQRYNCYFHAQTVVLATACRAYDWGFEDLWDEYGQVNKAPLVHLLMKRDIKIKLLATRPVQPIEEPRFPTQADAFGQRTVQLQLDPWYNIASRTLRRALQGVWATRESGMKESSLEELQMYVSDMIRAHAARVEIYKPFLGCNANEVELDVKLVMNEVWRRIWIG